MGEEGVQITRRPESNHLDNPATDHNDSVVGRSLLVSPDSTYAQVAMWFRRAALLQTGSGGEVIVRVIGSHGVYTLISSMAGWGEELLQKHADNEKMTHCRHWQRAHSSGPSLRSGFAASAHRAKKGRSRSETGEDSQQQKLWKICGYNMR